MFFQDAVRIRWDLVAMTNQLNHQIRFSDGARARLFVPCRAGLHRILLRFHYRVDEHATVVLWGMTEEVTRVLSWALIDGTVR